MLSPRDSRVTCPSSARRRRVIGVRYAAAMMHLHARNSALTPSPRPVIMTVIEHLFYAKTGQVLSTWPAARNTSQVALGRTLAMAVANCSPRLRRGAIVDPVVHGSRRPTRPSCSFVVARDPIAPPDPASSAADPIRFTGREDGDSPARGNGSAAEAAGWAPLPDGLTGLGWTPARVDDASSLSGPGELSPPPCGGRAGDQGCTRPAKGSVTR